MLTPVNIAIFILLKSLHREPCPFYVKFSRIMESLLINQIYEKNIRRLAGI